MSLFDKTWIFSGTYWWIRWKMQLRFMYNILWLNSDSLALRYLIKKRLPSKIHIFSGNCLNKMQCFSFASFLSKITKKLKILHAVNHSVMVTEADINPYTLVICMSVIFTVYIGKPKWLFDNGIQQMSLKWVHCSNKISIFCTFFII